jgi:peroxisomal membrane protein 2
MRTNKFLISFLALFRSAGECTAFVGPTTATSSKSIRAASSKSQLSLSPVEVWTAYNDALESNPLLVKSVTASAILGAADLAGQAIQKATAAAASSPEMETDQEGGIDWARTARFAVFGLILQAPWNHFYYLMLDGALPPTEEPWTPTTGIKVVIDQFVQAPIFTVLIFAFLGALEGKNLEAIKNQLDEDYKDTMLANWKLWVPATVLNIAFVPPILRVLYLNCVFFFWSIFLSLKLNKGDGEDLTA